MSGTALSALCGLFYLHGLAHKIGNRRRFLTKSQAWKGDRLYFDSIKSRVRESLSAEFHLIAGMEREKPFLLTHNVH